MEEDGDDFDNPNEIVFTEADLALREAHEANMDRQLETGQAKRDARRRKGLAALTPGELREKEAKERQYAVLDRPKTDDELIEQLKREGRLVTPDARRRKRRLNPRS